MDKKFSSVDIHHLVNRSIFVDANILIYLFWATGSNYWEKNYSNLFKILLKQKNNLFIDFLVISEVINRILRIEHKNYYPSLNFKDFRNSIEGKNILSDIYSIINGNILSIFHLVEKSFNKNELVEFLIVDELDFVDKATFKMCKENSFVLLTNDIDFKNADIEILTANSKILN